MDLHDLEHNTRDGVHIASLAGAWIAAVAGFGGMRDHDGKLSFAPRLPPRLEGLTFRILFRSRRLKVEVTRAEASYTLLDGSPIELTHHGETIELTSNATVTRAIPPAVQRSAPEQPTGRAPTRRGSDGTTRGAG